MSTVEKSIRLYAWKTNYQTFQVVQGESDSRTFNIQLFSTTIPVNLTACEVMFFAIKPDSTKVYVECEVVDAENGLARVTLTEQMCVVDGTVDCWVQVIGDGGADLRFEGMNIEVSPCPMTASIMSTDDMRAFLQMGAKLAAVETEVSNARAGKESLSAGLDANKKEVNVKISSLQQNLNTQKSRIDTMASLPEGSTRGDAELADLRIPAEGFTVPEGANAGTAVRAQFSALKEDLEKQCELFTSVIGVNKFNQTFITGKNLSTTDGCEISTNDSYLVTDFIDVSEADKINFYTCDINKIPHGGAYRWFWYKSDKTLLGYETTNFSIGDSKNIPTDAKYIRFVCVKYSSIPYYMMVFDTDDKPKYEDYTITHPQKVIDRFLENELRITQLEKVNATKTVITSINHLDESKMTNGYYNSNSKYVLDDRFRTLSEKIKIDNTKVVNAYICENIYGRAVSAWYSIVFFDENENIISTKMNPTYSSIESSIIDDIPQNARYCIPSFVLTSRGSRYMLTFESVQYGYDAYKSKIITYDSSVEQLRVHKWLDKKVLVIGDSISTSNYRGLASDGNNNPLWKKWDDILADRLGFTMTKDAISASGFIVQPETTQPGVKSICNRVDNYSSDANYDMIIVFAGINDFLQGVPVGTTPNVDKTYDFISAVDYSIKTLIEKYPKARIVALLPLPIGMYSNPSQNDTSAYVNALIDRYNYYNIPYLDLAHNSGFRPHIESFKRMFTLGGGSSTNVVPDGLHPNQEWDNNYLAPMIEEFINRFM